MAGEVRVTIDGTAVRAFINAPDGPVMAQLLVAAEQVKVTTIASLKPGFPQDFLGPTIVKRTASTGAGPRVLVGSDVTQTKPHVIRGNPLLVFFWPVPKGPGKTVFFRHVNHPGSNMAPYLARQLRLALAVLTRRP